MTREPATPNATTVPATGDRWDQWDLYESALRPGARSGLNLHGMTQYHMVVDLPASLEAVTGTAQIRYTNRSKDSLDRVYLHLFPNLWQDRMSVTDVEVGGRPATATLESGDSLLQVALPQPLAAGETTELALRFKVPVPHNLDVGNYGELAYLDGIVALAQFYPTVAVYDGHWHTETPATQGDVLFNQASLYDVRLTAPLTMTVAATGRTVSTSDNGDGTATWHLVGGPMRDFNIVASDGYQQASQQVGDVTVNSYFLAEDAGKGKDVLSYAASALETFQNDFGAYPYDELDVAETSTRALGIEYPGLIVLAREGQYDGKGRSEAFRATAAHEVAHQWWYNVVGDDQVNNPWLDESLAQYSTYLYFDQVLGAQAASAILDNFKARWARVNNKDTPIGLPVSAYSGPAYSAIVYGRGALFFVALQDKIGQADMLKFLKAYYRRYAWQVATPAGLQEVVQEVSGQDLNDLFKAWVYPAP